MADDAEDKTHDPTPRRRQQAREDGQVVQSRDLASATLLLGSLLVLTFAGGVLIDFLVRTLTTNLGEQAWLSADRDLIVERCSGLAIGLGKALAPILGLMFVVAIFGQLWQTGFLFMPSRLAPDIARLNPAQGLQRLFSWRSIMRVGFGVFKLAVVGTVAYYSLDAQRDELLGMGSLELPQIALGMWQICLSTGLKIGVALVCLGIVDYGYQRWTFERDLRMTPQELREEMRDMQGSRQLNARRKQPLDSIHKVASIVPTGDRSRR
jgi:flagellar biosynthetic protein FlhB